MLLMIIILMTDEIFTVISDIGLEIWFTTVDWISTCWCINSVYHSSEHFKALLEFDDITVEEIVSDLKQL